MKQLAIIASIILTATACTDGCPCEEDPISDAGSYAGKEKMEMIKPEELPTKFIPDTMWEWHNWVKL